MAQAASRGGPTFLVPVPILKLSQSWESARGERACEALSWPAAADYQKRPGGLASSRREDSSPAPRRPPSHETKAISYLLSQDRDLRWKIETLDNAGDLPRSAPT